MSTTVKEAKQVIIEAIKKKAEDVSTSPGDLQHLAQALQQVTYTPDETPKGGS